MELIGFRKNDILKLWKHTNRINEDYFNNSLYDSDEIVSDIEQNNTKAFVDSFDLVIDIHTSLTLKNFNLKKKLQLIEYIVNSSIIFEDAMVENIYVYDIENDDTLLMKFNREEVPSLNDYLYNNCNLEGLKTIYPKIKVVFKVNYELTKSISYKSFVKSFLKILNILSEKIMYSSKDAGYISFDDEFNQIVDLFETPFEDRMKLLYTYLFKNNDDEKLDNTFVKQYADNINIDRYINRACEKIYEYCNMKCSVMKPIIDKSGKFEAYIIRIMIENFPNNKNVVLLDDIMPILSYYILDSIPYMFMYRRHLAVSFHLADDLKISDIDKALYNKILNNRDTNLYTLLKSSTIRPTTFLKLGKKKHSCRFMYKSYDFGNAGHCYGIYILFPRKDGFLFANPQHCFSDSQFMSFQDIFLKNKV